MDPSNLVAIIAAIPLPALLVFGASFGVVGALVYFGVIQGRKAPAEKRADAAEIVALTVDSRSIEKLAGEAAGLAVAVTEFKAALVDVAERYERSNERLADGMKDLAVEMRVTREVHAAKGR